MTVSRRDVEEMAERLRTLEALMLTSDELSIRHELLSANHEAKMKFIWHLDPWGFRDESPGRRHNVQDKPTGYTYHIVDEIGEVQVEVEQWKSEVIEELRKAGLTWKQIANCLNMDELLPLRERYRKQRREQRKERIKRWIRGD